MMNKELLKDLDTILFFLIALNVVVFSFSIRNEYYNNPNFYDLVTCIDEPFNYTEYDMTNLLIIEKEMKTTKKGCELSSKFEKIGSFIIPYSVFVLFLSIVLRFFIIPKHINKHP